MDASWLAKVAGVLRGLRTPLSLGGLTVIVLCKIYSRVLDLDVLSTITASQTSGVLNAVVGYMFWLALVAVVLGTVGFLIGPGAANGGKGRR